MIFNSIRVFEKNACQWAVCFILFRTIYFVGNYAIFKTSTTENLVPLDENLNKTNQELNRSVHTITPLKWLVSASNNKSASSQSGQRLEPGRYWIYSEAMMEGTKRKTFKLLSYNVLSQTLLEDHPYLYRLNHKEALDWNFRSRLLFSEIKHLDADILCLQEVESTHLHIFQKRLQSLGYRGIYKKRSHERVDGVAIFYKTKSFILQEYTTVEFFQPDVWVLNRDNVALVAKFAHRDSPSESVVVATTHLLFNLKRHDVKLAQTQLLLTEVERYAYAGIGTNGPKYLPVIITGDMNFKPFSGVYNFLTEGRLHYQGLSKKNLTTRVKGNGQALNNTLLPRRLQVTDSCQHLGILPLREHGLPDHNQELKHIKIQNTEYKFQNKYEEQDHKTVRNQQDTDDVESSKILRSLMPQPDNSVPEGLDDKRGKLELDDEKESFHRDRFESGELCHPFNLQSAYTEHDSEVTTYHDSWITVDYIFFSVPKTKLERGLTLLATFKLATVAEAARLGHIPNFDSPSDHYPLLAMFGFGNEQQETQ